MFTVLGCNFHSSHPPEAVNLYHSIFEWEILVSDQNHGELEIIQDPKFILYFDKANSHCPTYPGCLTLKSSDEKQILDLDPSRKSLWDQNFSLEFKDEKHGYQSWLDPWKNRIWIIE